MPAAADIRWPGLAAAAKSRRVFLGASASLFAASTAVTIVWGASMAEMGGALPMPGGWTLSMAWLPVCGRTWFDAAVAFLGMWIVMMAAMMLPSLTPVLWRYRLAFGRVGPVLLVGTSYFLIWMLTGLAIFPAGAMLSAAIMEFPPLARAVPAAASAAVLIAGIVQFSAWKARHLAHCRATPGPRLPAAPGAALRHGLRLGLHCTYSCAGPTAILLVLGVMNLCVMAVLAVAITTERLGGERMARANGVVAIGVGLLLILRAAGFG